MQLPVDEEDDEEVVGVPEPLEVGTAALLNREPNHDTEGGGYNPASRTRASDEVGRNERKHLLASRLRIRVNHGELSEVDHVRHDVDNGEDDDRPSDSLVERNVLIEGNERVEGRLAEERDKVTANREKDEGHIDMEDERSRTGDRWNEHAEAKLNSAIKMSV